MVVQTADERRNVGSARLGGQQRLPDGEDQRAVDADAPFGEMADGADSLGRARQLDDDMRVERRQRFALAHHSFEIRRDHLGAHVALHDPADFDVMAAARLLAPDILPGHQRRVGRHPVEHAHRMGLANLIEIRRIDKEFHRIAVRF